MKTTIEHASSNKILVIRHIQLKVLTCRLVGRGNSDPSRWVKSQTLTYSLEKRIKSFADIVRDTLQTVLIKLSVRIISTAKRLEKFTIEMHDFTYINIIKSCKRTNN